MLDKFISLFSGKGFYLGLTIFYLLIFFSPNKIINFSAYILMLLFFYFKTKKITTSLLYALFLSLFSDVSFGRSLFLMEPMNLNLGSGYWISPTTILTISAIPFIFRKITKKIILPDLLILAFFVWNSMVFFVFPYPNSFFGLIQLAESCLTYYLFRIFLNKRNYEYIPQLMISVFIFQSLVSIFQLISQKPLGLISEISNIGNPFGYTAAENDNIFRITGTFWHPNFLASFILVSIPFIFKSGIKSLFMGFLKALSILMIIFTYSRASWLLLIIMSFVRIVNFKSRNYMKFNLYSKSSIFTVLLLILVLLLALPVLLNGLNSFSQAFSEFGSVGIRVKLNQEGLSQIFQNPISGIGINRSLEQFVLNPATDIFTKIQPDSFFNIHNTFIQIAAETGLPGFVFFSLFLISSITHYRKTLISHSFKETAYYGLIGLIFMSMINPFFHTTQIPIMFFLVSVCLI